MQNGGESFTPYYLIQKDKKGIPRGNPRGYTMNYYKVIFSKVAYVKATDEEEARDMAMDEDYIFMDEDVVAVEPSCRADIQKELNNWEGIYAEEN